MNKNNGIPAMLYQEFECCPGLSSAVLCYWKFEVGPSPDPTPSFTHFIMPDGAPSLVVFSLPAHKVTATALQGPTKRVTEKDVFYNSKTMGIRLRPGIIHSLGYKHGGDLRDQTIAPAPVSGELDLTALSPLLNDDTAWTEWLNTKLTQLEWGEKATKAKSVITLAAQRIMQSAGTLSIRELTDALPLSERQLQKRFREEVGLTMKEFAMTMRLRDGIINLEYQQQSYQDVVNNKGYFDQAHFIRDFSRVSAIPLPDFKRYVRRIEHKNLNFRK
ncbi:helix-turn-helix domain-containing protein [Gilvimarinus sp. SDUM040013]|uniref:Helix-turn-helix domain-containing protein n=1 Tax=Gilvimarinus gilvus TaxID=3058038 RepID=A0ABU4RW97_9GAMM|nr:helix-turn-helix domain-containing protein [Gilvimarinus sp. SDUM040013]MDO3386571.1 helix-turn-helix domain-containing protein [Gilvimarinus sp. SDUM040013]MDX6849147.1 helix-turn-helix domain-containing protein [Gilvimarinus sp. SDUM040013]